ncbi:AFR241Wp [Eremothecium gossypii ATCC 10895]|uniref:Dolichyl-diphosphooligosaccharide-protein glycosyltransferase subunit OST5 n=1 Tax=Eremothecium gossypii (strain ATCC 10895 / CBS 109.51 / FGSC 9923 / NRRL Y-1056) TaxID=284811 RepID=Q753T5_EREGS|nr:AFR241Wp [Eremothecium gossypii ATCC 10895]AAS53612.2 AFR241Wp [Eremothecium gossypii ATCC 10895]AEY97925.1 FAFR241Wp [Eremothecium gossypii FDAG1]
MSYEKLYKQFQNGADFSPMVPLEKQPYYGATALVISMLCILGAIVSANRSKGLAVPLLIFIPLGLVGSLLFGLASIFLANSFGVYV